MAILHGNEQELEIDSLHQVVNDLKEELEVARTKVKDLNEIILNKEKIIKYLENCKNKENTYDCSAKQSKGRYWNCGFCRLGDKCQYVHCKEDCKTHLDKGSCQDRHCERRHIRHCRYFNNISESYRGDHCQYLHSRNRKEERDYLNNTSELHEKINCNQCDHNTSQKSTLKNHLNSYHVENYSKAISSFIYRLHFDEYAREYRDYFGWHVFNTGEASHKEEMKKRHGANCIVKNIN